MARSKTGSFWLTESITIPAGSDSGTGDLDLGAYVDVGDQQALAVEAVDFIWQAGDNATPPVLNSALGGPAGGNTAFDTQLTDLNPGGVIVQADDNSLVASGSVNIDDTNNVLSFGPDLYPDSFGKLDESRMVVNDTLHIVTTASNNVAANTILVCTVRVKARIVKLGTKDWMAIAIQSTASDN